MTKMKKILLCALVLVGAASVAQGVKFFLESKSSGLSSDSVETFTMDIYVINKYSSAEDDLNSNSEMRYWIHATYMSTATNRWVTHFIDVSKNMWDKLRDKTYYTDAVVEREGNIVKRLTLKHIGKVKHSPEIPLGW